LKKGISKEEQSEIKENLTKSLKLGEEKSASQLVYPEGDPFDNQKIIQKYIVPPED
jgi:hypothetical protein